MTYSVIAPTINLNLRVNNPTLSRALLESIGQTINVYLDSTSRDTAAPVDAAAPYLRTQSPTGHSVEYEQADMLQQMLGTWVCPLLFDEPGLWNIYGECGGPPTAASQIQIYIKPSPFPAPGNIPTSPVLLPPGSFWFNAFRAVSSVVPTWASLPASETNNADQFWLNGGIVSLPSNSSLLARSPAGLALGDLWNNGGTVMCNGNPGLPVTSTIPGVLLYNGGALTVTQRIFSPDFSPDFS